MANIELTFQEMRRQADELERMNKKLRGQQKPEMEGHQRTLTASWDGVANDEFDKQFRSDMVQFDNFCRLIDDYIRALRAAADQYEKTEIANRQIAQQRTYK